MSFIGKDLFYPPYYFFLKENQDGYTLYYSVENTLSEATKKDKAVKFKKSSKNDIKKLMAKTVGSKGKFKISDIEKEIKNIKKSEVDEFVDSDLSVSNSNVPILNARLHPKKTQDQTVAATRQTMNPILRGYRVYYGESVVRETDMSDAFGYEETKDLDGKKTYKYYKEKLDLSPEEAKDRTEQQGKDPSGKRTKKAPKSIRNKKGFIDRLTLSEKEEKMLEDIISKRLRDTDIMSKDQDVSKFFLRQLRVLRRMAEKEGLSNKEILKLLNKNE